MFYITLWRFSLKDSPFPPPRQALLCLAYFFFFLNVHTGDRVSIWVDTFNVCSVNYVISCNLSVLEGFEL